MAVVEYVSTPSYRTLSKKTHSDLVSRVEALGRSLGEAIDTAGMSRQELARIVLDLMRRLPDED